MVRWYFARITSKLIITHDVVGGEEAVLVRADHGANPPVGRRASIDANAVALLQRDFIGASRVEVVFGDADYRFDWQLC